MNIKNFTNISLLTIICMSTQTTSANGIQEPTKTIIDTENVVYKDDYNKDYEETNYNPNDLVSDTEDTDDSNMFIYSDQLSPTTSPDPDTTINNDQLALKPETTEVSPITTFDSIYKQMPWLFLEKKLKTNTENNFSTLGFLIKTVTTIAASTPGILKFQKTYNNKDGISDYILDTVLTLGLPAITYYVTNTYIDKPLRKKSGTIMAFTDYIQNWKYYKEYSPESLHPFFNEISETYNTTDNKIEYLKTVAPIAMENIRTILQKHNDPQDPLWKSLISPILLTTLFIEITFAYKLAKDISI